MEIVRLVTVHPAWVHVTLGLIPLFVLAYWVAAVKASERWTLVGDVALALCAAVTCVTFGFGLVSNFELNWPGGLERWRWLHLGGGAATLVTLVVLAGARLRARRRGVQTSSFGAAGFSILVAAVAGYTGWIGGELLVYHAGMAVEAAADGALAPPVPSGVQGNPKGLMSGMGAIRASWAEVETSLAYTLVHHPEARQWTSIGVGARRLEGLAAWLQTPEVAREIKEDGASQSGEPSPPGRARAEFIHEANKLQHAASSVRVASDRHDVAAVSAGAGQVQSVCVGCHAALRWRHSGSDQP
jgi:uncharacterized membrane protein/mono/diheme cytochrome c family protein